ncbi:redoxin domain-containing protein [Flavobacterium beibuense]|uniref:redoxin domain-containing protein n=1 Tax=Flavobacterium beibuense TaxID=657326 RepID=UPI003A921015
MKKILVITLTVLAIMSFKGIDLVGNEFKIVGTVSSDFNGQKVFLAKSINDDVMSKLDSTIVKNGKFTFNGVADKPEQRLIYFEEKLMDGQIAIYAEKGNITINVNAEDIPKSVVGGTLNNNALAKLNVMLIEVGEKEEAFKNEHMDNFSKAKSEGDTETQNRIIQEYSKLTKENNKNYIAFIEENPNSLICAELFPVILKDQDVKAKDLKPIYDKMGPAPKATEMGQKVETYLNQMLANEKAMEATEVGKTAPDFSASTPNGKTLSLNQAKGKVTIIDFWASWCGPCRKENPNVVAMYNELHDKGLNIIGVSLDKDDAKWKGAIEKDNLTWQHISNLQGWDEPIAVQYGVTSIPATVILDKNGVIVARNLRGEELKAKVKELLAE